MDMKELAEEAAEAIKDTIEDLSRLKGWKMSTIKKAFAMLPTIVKKVEHLKKMFNLSNGDCRGLAVELVIRFAPAPWWLPERIYRWVLGEAVDTTVAALKDKF